jgi:putative hydrolase of the HAD superfamily
MNKPKMILFDYGQTLVELDKAFRGIEGYKAVLKHAVKNPFQISAKELDRFAGILNKDIGRYQPGIEQTNSIEVHSHLFHHYLFDYYGIEFDLPPAEIEKIYWDHAAKGKPTENSKILLQYLRDHRIRTAIISNISFSGKALEDRVKVIFRNMNLNSSLLPANMYLESRIDEYSNLGLERPVFMQVRYGTVVITLISMWMEPRRWESSRYGIAVQ